MICMTPVAPTGETSELFNPLSCQAIADAIAGGTPLWLAVVLTTRDVTLTGVGYGGPAKTDPDPPPPGSLSAAPASSRPLTLSPLIEASSPTGTPSRAAIADSVSPGLTT